MNKRISIIGMGMLGTAWSIAFARAGCAVIGWDPLTEASNASLKVLRRERLPEAALQQRQLWRDQRLMALRQHPRDVGQETGN